MRKRLSRMGNSYGLVIEKPILDLLGVTAETEFDVELVGGRQIVITLPSEDHMTRYPIWIRRPKDADPKRLNAQDPAIDYTLEPIKEYSATEGLYVLRHPPRSDHADQPVQMGGFSASETLQKPDDHRVVMKGSMSVWQIVDSRFNSTAKRVEIALRKEAK